MLACPVTKLLHKQENTAINNVENVLFTKITKRDR
jgi:hypothetical protein